MKLIGTGDKLMNLSAQGCIKRVGEVSLLLQLLLFSYNCKDTSCKVVPHRYDPLFECSSFCLVQFRYTFFK